MRGIELAGGRGVALVDDDDYDRISKFAWFLRVPLRARTTYAVRARLKMERGPVWVFMHLEVMGRRAGFEIDHINLNGLDNTKGNLRWATHSQNGANRQAQIGNASGFKGVRWHYDGPNPWMARIRVNGKDKYLGLFKTPQEAHAAYCVAAKIEFGEFARAV